jgi:hypothetical protein
MDKELIARRGFLARTTKLAAGVCVGASVGTGSFAAAQDKGPSPSGNPKPETRAPKPAQKDEWAPLFNGKDLSGWKPDGNAAWAVEQGCLVGKQGPNNAPGDLFTTEEFSDFELVVEYKIQWPANSGVWFRYQSPEKAYQADILEYKKPVAYSGTLYCPGKMFLAANTDPKIEKKDDWNTMKVRAQGDHLVITLNDKVTADVHDSSYAKGRIGFQVHPGEEFKDMKITVRKIALRKL